MNKFRTKAGPLRYNVREIFSRGGIHYWSSCGYAATITEARATAARFARPGETDHKIEIHNADGKVFTP